jgi:hypothetical protein
MPAKDCCGLLVRGHLFEDMHVASSARKPFLLQYGLQPEEAMYCAGH